MHARLSLVGLLQLYLLWVAPVIFVIIGIDIGLAGCLAVVLLCTPGRVVPSLVFEPDHVPQFQVRTGHLALDLRQRHPLAVGHDEDLENMANVYDTYSYFSGVFTGNLGCLGCFGEHKN